MKKVLTLSLFPFLGIAAFVITWLWFGPAINSALTELSHPGRVEGMLLVRQGGSVDVIERADHDFNMHGADGTHYKLSFENGHLTRFTVTEPGNQPLPVELGILSNPPTSSNPLVPEILSSRILDMVNGNAATIRRTLKREHRRKDEKRLVSIEKTERLRSRLGMTTAPRSFTAEADGLSAQGLNLTPPVWIVTTGLFKSISDPQKPGVHDVSVSFTESVDGKSIDEKRRDFLLSRETWRTEFRSLIRTRFQESDLIALSDIGRRTQPANGLTLFDECLVKIPDGRIELANITASPPAPGPRLNRLQWFSRVCEAVFARWAYPIMLSAIGLILLTAGGVLISLAILPPKKSQKAVS